MTQISIIIPVYNLEKYIKNCIQSIINQTFQDFEAIFVNDGSTDDTLKILLEYKEKDKRIKIINKENGGAASARNEGIKIAQGNYITFVDGDDIIEEKYLENIYKVIQETQAKFIILRMQRSKEKYFESPQPMDGYIKLNKIEAMKQVLYQKKTDSGVPGKIIKKEILKQIEFPEGCLYEDLAIILDLIDEVDEVLYLNYCGYQYIYREEGTTWKKFNKDKLQLIDICQTIEKKYVKKYPELKKACNYRKLESNFHLFFQAYKVDKEISNQLWKNIKKDRVIVLKDKEVKMKTKIAIVLSFFGKKVLYYIFRAISNSNMYRRGKC